MTQKETTFSGSREKVIAEEAFLEILEDAAEGLLSIREKIIAGSGRAWGRRFVSRFLKEVHVLRTVLNDHDAQENRAYSYMYELVAGIRGYGTVMYIMNHLRERFLRSPFAENGPQSKAFLEDIRSTVTSCGHTLGRLLTAFLEECAHLGIELPPTEPPGFEAKGPAPEVRRHLPHNLDEEEMGGEGEKIAQVASSFLKIAEQYASMAPPELTAFPDLRNFVLRKLDEEQARVFQTAVHAIQSKYDTYIQYTATEAKDPDLKRLRSVVSLVLHLFEVTTLLIHFYERHENDIRSERTKARISEIVDKGEVLDRAVNYAFRGAGWLLEEGAEICRRLIPAFTSIREVTFDIPDDVRLHIRPAALIASIVNHHGTPVTMHMGNGDCDASSVTEVIYLAADNVDAKQVRFRGDERPLADLAVLFEVGVRDDGHDEIHRRLEYLNHR